MLLSFLMHIACALHGFCSWEVAIGYCIAYHVTLNYNCQNICHYFLFCLDIMRSFSLHVYILCSSVFVPMPFQSYRLHTYCMVYPFIYALYFFYFAHTLQFGSSCPPNVANKTEYLSSYCPTVPVIFIFLHLICMHYVIT